jgi:hypothetical protein
MSQQKTDLANDNQLLRRIVLALSNISTGDTALTALNELSTKLTNIYGAVDELEIKAENINLNTDTLEAKSQAIADALAAVTIGNELQVDIVSSTLPSGAATETTLASIDSVNGAIADAANPSGSRQAQLRSIAESCDANESSLNNIEATVATEAKQDIQITRAHAETGAFLLASTGAKTYTFHGIQVIDTITVASAATTNITGDSLAGAVLNPGYHPIAGTAINCSAVGLAYLIGA